MITQQQIDFVVASVEAGRTQEDNLTELRNRFPELHFTWCLEDEIGCEQPLLTRESFSLYLVNGQHHCLSLTTDPQLANGMVIAEL